MCDTGKLCMIAVSAAMYRMSIFKRIDSSFNCDWYIGVLNNDIATFDTSILKNVSYFRYGYINPKLYWKKGILSLLFSKKYNTFILCAESRSISDYLFVGLKKLLCPRKKIILWTHGWYGKEGIIEKKIKLWLFKRANAILLYGIYGKELLVKEGISSSKLFVIGNSLNYGKQLKLREQCETTNIYVRYFNNTNPTVIFVGRLTRVKRLDILLYAVNILKKQEFKVNVVIVGDGEERRSLEKLVNNLDINQQVWFYGPCYDEAINAELIYNADVCVAPGNIGLTAVHSMMFGCPAITHDDYKWQMPEFEAIKLGITGAFFERNNANSLADTIRSWLVNNTDERQRRRKSCYTEIDNHWNPDYQINIINGAINYTKQNA